MTYNEWRDELKQNLLCVSQEERNRVLDYYAEAYADRRDAGYSEREITAEFGAPYDAAQRILAENPEPLYENRAAPHNVFRNTPPPPRRNDINRENAAYQGGNYVPQPNPAQFAPKPAPRKSEDNTWIFVLLLVIFAVPIFIVIMGMAVITAGLCVAPFALLISGAATVGAGVGELFSSAASGAATIGTGLIIFGVSLIVGPVCIKLVKLMWKLFKSFFIWLKSLFGGKEKTV